MKNTIATRIADFLKGFPPFSMLSREECEAIACEVEVLYFPKKEYIFKINETVKDHFFVVKDGAVGLYRDNTTLLVDTCDEGDIFGLRALLRKDKYELNAIALEESVLYSISTKLLEKYITTNIKASHFLMESFASNTNLAATIDAPDWYKSANEISEIQTIDYSKNPITCKPSDSIQEAAKLMRTNRVGSIVIVENNKPKGIITDKDLRIHVATGDINIDEPVTKIMSTPVITYPEDLTVAQAQIAMIKHKITHLCITKDGTSNSNLSGILSEHDIIVLRDNTPSSLMKEIKRAKSVDTLRLIRERAHELLKRFLKQDVSIIFCTNVINALNHAITQKIIENAINNQNEKPPVSFAWFAIGSQGRNEQLLLTDQDNALVFENVNEDTYQKVKSYFLTLSSQINTDLNTIGYEFCPANMMASNPKWCMSVNEWNNQFNRWISTPDQDNLMLCMIFFDFEYVYGNIKLIEQLSENIFSSIESHEIFLTYLGRNALQNPPPLSFFRQFLVEQSGEHKDQFDVKARAMMPLVDAARLLILSHNIKLINNTIDRFNKLSELEPQNKEVYFQCAEAFKDLLEFRTKEGIRENGSGRFIDLKTLHKSDRLRLKRSFTAIKNIQELIQTRFRLSQLM